MSYHLCLLPSSLPSSPLNGPLPNRLHALAVLRFYGSYSSYSPHGSYAYTNTRLHNYTTTWLHDYTSLRTAILRKRACWRRNYGDRTMYIPILHSFTNTSDFPRWLDSITVIGEACCIITKLRSGLYTLYSVRDSCSQHACFLKSLSTANNSMPIFM